MFASLFANIFYPFLAAAFVFAAEYRVSKSFASQFAAFGTNLCVLALGALVGVMNNPLLLRRWGDSTTLIVAFTAGIVDAILVVATIKIRESAKDEDWKARVNVRIGMFALVTISAINVVTYW
jgi:hypothetical protein